MPRNKARYSNEKKIKILLKFFQKKYLVIFSGLFLLIACLLYFFCFFPTSKKSVDFGENQVSELPRESKISEDFNIFYDSFSGLGRIDTSQTSLYLNGAAAAVMFPPDFSFAPASTSTENTAGLKESVENFNEFLGPYQDERCLRRNCLSQDNLQLYYNNRKISRPAKLSKSDIKGISIGTVGNKWLVGFTTKIGDKYSGSVYYFDGKKFSSLVFPKVISSKYFGLFGFGGEQSDFLVIYGAYQGEAYRFRGKEVTDISKFFKIRVMKGGFKPEIIKTKKGEAVDWYVYSQTNNRPQFLKLWQNGTTEIIGEIIFDLEEAQEKSTTNQATKDFAISFKLKDITAKAIIFSANVKNGDQFRLYEFSDYGFKNEQGGTLTFLPISFSAEEPEITLEKIKTSQITIDEASRETTRLKFSIDNQTWRDVPFGQNFSFQTAPNFFKNFRLRLDFSPLTDKFSSPFLEEFLFEYYCQKKE